MTNTVKLTELINDNYNLRVLQGQECVSGKKITVSDVYRPGLELSGYFDFYPADRVQLLGRTEISYAARLDHDLRRKVFEKICQKETPCLLVSRNLPVPVELKEAAEAAGTPILISNDATTYLMSMITQYLAVKLAERSSVHGVLVEVFGMGVLLTGESGVGKSETALALVQHGHRLIADDRVDVYQRDHETVVGEAPRILKHLMEIRGIGIIDVLKLFGIGAIKDETEISLVINLTNWDSKANYDRLGFQENTRIICGIAVPQVTIPVKVGRNMENIVEVAVMNFRAKAMGFDAAKTFDENLTSLIAENSEEEKGGKAD
ncbi:HPr(Ser) kinase/phosphatase [Lactobacillus delbrueckii subsp. lactis]|uniref:HPr kinase/phosphorylase n=3 Tax=Lactobacillus TaxID=1578 RepID=A0ABD4W042_9LACO|nr:MULTISPECIES: HPr(Ser) kinase/phosphatase [Lactobacillus]CAH1706566.1 serine/threonine protein kinase/phosphorylase (pyrophosphate-producing) [Lactobacillus delbrueckii subsp. delbrueckii]APG68174.1 HPr kinase/phosphorylase [Lactobacillus delbrueckii subsp. lactis]MCD5489556.1 HPr(Ser) kinase/phosphatase [Lactobacillus delbrueckii subsp. lactis]MCD5495014.1 HPr(Ser) kinase/phosphatase [Lactobacillus delbrueckii subsp. lactis]MCD5496767.1 HPr(Ser) kinase/phosphatase [Lactobacillus delbruecki